MPSPTTLWKARPRSLALHAGLGLVGLVLVVDGALRGEPRHQLVAFVLGGALLLPITSALVLGERALRVWDRIALSAASLLVLLLALEAAARLLDLKAFSYVEVVRDPVYGHVHVPGRGGLDEWGFRNVRVPERADVVCVGDSQTYGTSVRRRDSYPSQLAELSGLEVYNMSLGGYGPIQYELLVERALSLDPRAVTVGVYFGNDLADADRFLALEAWADLRDPRRDYPPPNDVDFGDRRSLNLAMALVDGVMLHSRVLRTVGNELKLAMKLDPRFERLAADASVETAHGYDAGAVATRFQPEYRLSLIDPRIPQVRNGLEVTLGRLAAIGARCLEEGVPAYLLLIHNKETYYAALMERRGEPMPRVLARLSREERAMTGRLARAAEEAGFTVVDPTEALVASLEADVAIYPPDVDAHLDRTGSGIVARALWEAIEPRLGEH